MENHIPVERSDAIAHEDDIQRIQTGKGNLQRKESLHTYPIKGGLQIDMWIRLELKSS